MRVIDEDSGKFSWFESKAMANLRKHGLSFEEARYAFCDPLAVISLDSSSPFVEERWVLVGRVPAGSLVVVVHTFEEGEAAPVHIISARRATSHERFEYETGEYSVREAAVTYRGDPVDDMKDEYDFSNGVRGKYSRYFRPDAFTTFPIYLERDVLKYFSEIAESRGLETREVLNEILRRQMPAAEAAEGTAERAGPKGP